MEKEEILLPIKGGISPWGEDKSGEAKLPWLRDKYRRLTPIPKRNTEKGMRVLPGMLGYR